jgi:hypothetical protein
MPNCQLRGHPPQCPFRDIIRLYLAECILSRSESSQRSMTVCEKAIAERGADVILQLTGAASKACVTCSATGTASFH